MITLRRLALLAVCTSITATALADDRSVLRIATATSTENSGLMNVLVPAFESKTNYTARVVSAGTGRALKLLENGDVEVTLTHARTLEERLIRSGAAIDRRQVMYNDFIIVGPNEDPASVRDASDIHAAFDRIRKTRSIFISRGDDSGTHTRERSFWTTLGAAPDGNWYRETGQGMGRTLQITAELNAYTLTDRGTWLAHHEQLPLKILFQGDERLLNVYSILIANPLKHPDLNHDGAMAFAAWLLSNEAADLIRGFTRDRQQLFVPFLPQP